MDSTLTIKTLTGQGFTFRPVPLPRFPSAMPADWLNFQRVHVPNSQLSDETQDEVQRFMRCHETEALADGGKFYTLAGGMLAYCDPDFHTRAPELDDQPHPSTRRAVLSLVKGTQA